jgi:hypothetical protein
MPLYSEHRSNAAPVALSMGLAVLVYSIIEGYSILLSIGFGGLASIFVFVGAALPDVDHHASIPRKKAGVLAVATGICVYILGVRFVAQTISQYFRTPFIGFVVFAVMVLLGLSLLEPVISLTGETFDSLTHHRGFTHTLVFALVVAIAVFYFPDVIVSVEGFISTQVGNLVNMIQDVPDMIASIGSFISTQVGNLVNMIQDVPDMTVSTGSFISNQVENLISIVANDKGIRLLIAVSIFSGIYKHLKDDGIDI